MDEKKSLDNFISNIFNRLDKVNSKSEKPSKKILIFATPRSGSSFFCDMLSQTKAIGEPLEWLHDKFLFAYEKKFKKKIDLQEYINYIFSKTTSENGIFSIKVQIPDYLFLLNEKKFNLLSLNFDDIILISRRDKIAQAYSLTKALASNQWFSFIRPSSEINPDNIKNSDILCQLANIIFWEELIESHIYNRLPLRYIYEDFIKKVDFYNLVLKDLNIRSHFLTGIYSCLEIQTTYYDLKRIEQLKKNLNIN